MASYLNLFELHNLQLIRDGEWASLFFLEKITPLSLAVITGILWSSNWEALCGME